MFKLDDNLLRELGLGSLHPAEKNKMLGHIYETLEMRVGMTLAQQMSDAQLKEFETFIDSNDEAGALRWLETNFPDYKQVVANELEKLKGEIKVAAPQILAASQQAAAAADPAGAAAAQPAPQSPPPAAQMPVQGPTPAAPQFQAPPMPPQPQQTPPAAGNPFSNDQSSAQ